MIRGIKRRTVLSVSILALFAALLLPDILHAFEWDLSKSVMYARRGFSRDWIASSPAGDPAWMKIEPGVKGLFPLRIKEMGFENLPSRGFLSFKNFPPENFTFVTEFEISDESFIREKHPALFLAQIGINWEVYINGNLLRSEMELNQDGSISRGRHLRLQLISINPHKLKTGKNTLAFRITGDPSHTDTGFYRSGPYLIGEYDALRALSGETDTLVLLFVYLLIGFYHIFLYLNRREDQYNLFYGLFSVGLFVYIIARTAAVYTILPDTSILLQIELIALYTLFPLMGSFLDLILLRRVSLFTRGYGVFCALIILLTLASPGTTDVDILKVWQMTALIPLIYYLFYTVGYTYFRAVRNLYSNTGRLFSSIGAALVRSAAGNLLIGCVIMAGCTVYDIIDAMYFSSTVSIAKYGFFFFVVGIALLLANRFLYIHGKVETLNTDLETNLKELREANRIIGLSEEKYKLLVEGSREIIFTLDGKLNFMTVNRAVNVHLRYNPAEILKMNFLDLVYESPTITSFRKQIVTEKLDAFIRTRDPLSFKIQMKAAQSSEPRDMQVRLEYLKADGENEIIGKATSILDDSLLNSFISENQKYSIDNFITIAEEMSYRMTRNLKAFIDSREITMIRVALFEVLLNAVEHGNLSISFEEKSEAVMNGNYMEFLSRRRENPAFTGKKIKIEYSVNSERVVYIVTDEGEGFDYEHYVKNDSERANTEMLAHGRGITMARNIFDRVKYNEKGNQVMLIKYFRMTPA